MRILLCLGIFGAYQDVAAASYNSQCTPLEYQSNGTSLLDQINDHPGCISEILIHNQPTVRNPSIDNFPHRHFDIGAPPFYMLWLHSNMKEDSTIADPENVYYSDLYFDSTNPAETNVPSTQYENTELFYVENAGFSTNLVAGKYRVYYENCSKRHEHNVIPPNWNHNSIPTELGKFTNLKQLRIKAQEGKRTEKSINLTEFNASNVHTLDVDDYSPYTDCSGNFNLTGTIPTEIGLLTNLEVLELQGLGLTGTIPTQLAQLTKLEMLFLGGNSFGDGTQDLTGGLTGSVTPDLLQNMTKLKVLYLNLNAFDLVDVRNISSLAYVNAAILRDNSKSRYCGGAFSYAHTTKTTAQKDAVEALENAIHGSTTYIPFELNQKINDLREAFNNQTVFWSNTKCADAPTTTTPATTSYATMVTTTRTTTSTTTVIGCSNYTTTGDVNSSTPTAITATPQYQFCVATASLNCPCHLIFADETQIVHGSFSDLKGLCSRLETLSVHDNVFLNGFLTDLSACTKIQRLVFGRSTLLPFPIRTSDFAPFTDLKILVAHNLYGSINLFEIGFSFLEYVDVSSGFLTGTPTKTFWDTVFSKNTTISQLDDASLGSNVRTLNTSTFAVHNFLAASSAIFGEQFPSGDAPPYPFQRNHPITRTTSTAPATGGHSGSGSSSGSSDDSSNRGIEIAIVVLLALILLAIISFIGFEGRKKYEKVDTVGD